MSFPLNRRQFLATSAAAATAASLAPSAYGLNDPTDVEVDTSYYGGYPMGIQSYSLRNFNMHEAIRHTEGLGLRYLEVFNRHFEVGTEEATIVDILETMERSNITMNSYGVVSFSDNHEANRRIFEFAQRTGLRNISANPSEDSFESLDELVEEFDIRIAIHNHGPGSRYSSLEQMLAAIQDHDPRIGVCIDTGHTLRSDEDPLLWVRELEGRTYGLHIKDVAARVRRTHTVIIGTGELDIQGLFTTIKETGFPADGAMSLEYESNPANPIDDLTQSLVAVNEAIAAL